MSVFYSYFFNSVSFLIVGFLVLFFWSDRRNGAWLVQALGVSFIWSLYVALSATGFFYLNSSNQVFFELLRNASWFLLIWKLYGLNTGHQNAEFFRDKTLWIYGCLLFLFLLLNLFASTVLSSESASLNQVSIIAPFVFVTINLVLIEQWYRNTPREDRWGIRYLFTALLIIFVFDFILYSEALLFGRLDAVLWEARGWIGGGISPLVALFVSRNKKANTEIRISHRAAFFSTSIILAGLYLIIMALVGYYIRWFGSGFGSAFQIVFLVLGITFLIMLVGSGHVRAVISVWISKHFFSYRYDYREEWLGFNDKLATLDFSEAYEHQLILAVSESVSSPGGALWILNGREFPLAGSWGCKNQDALSSLESVSLIEYFQNKKWIIVVDEYRQEPEKYPDLNLPVDVLDEAGLWVIVPLVHQQGLQGILALVRPLAPKVIGWEERDLLNALASQVASVIALKRASDALAEARQFEAFNRLSAFVVHDLKNVISQLSLVTVNAERHKHNPEFVDDALSTVDNAVGRMSRLLGQLRQQSQLNSRAEVVDVCDILKEVETSFTRQGLPLQVGSVCGSPIRIEIERFVSILSHLVQNAFEATSDGSAVVLSAERQQNDIVIRVDDAGSGMDERFIRERLFRPFDTTKGSAGMGIGVYEAQQFVLANNGSISVRSRLGEGTSFFVRLPYYQGREST